MYYINANILHILFYFHYYKGYSQTTVKNKTRRRYYGILTTLLAVNILSP
jgi:hypothetical protein